MNYDYSELLGKIRAKFKTQKVFAIAMQMSPCTLSKKLNNLVDFNRQEIERACDLLGIPLTEVTTYFFTPKVVKTQQSN